MCLSVFSIITCWGSEISYIRIPIEKKHLLRILFAELSPFIEYQPFENNSMKPCQNDMSCIIRKPVLAVLRPGLTSTGLFYHTRLLEASSFIFSKKSGIVLSMSRKQGASILF